MYPDIRQALKCVTIVYVENPSLERVKIDLWNGTRRVKRSGLDWQCIVV